MISAAQKETKTIDKHSRTHQKRELFEPKKSALISPRFATTGRKVLLSDGTISNKTVSTNHIDFEHCAQCKTRGEIQASDGHHVAKFHDFLNFRTIDQTWSSFKLLTPNFPEPLVFGI